jgi:hypothetical protein
MLLLGFGLLGLWGARRKLRKWAISNLIHGRGGSPFKRHPLKEMTPLFLAKSWVICYPRFCDHQECFGDEFHLLN